jgi:hypothetical protein
VKLVEAAGGGTIGKSDGTQNLPNTMEMIATTEEDSDLATACLQKSRRVIHRPTAVFKNVLRPL